jgi:hypothetical protein
MNRHLPRLSSPETELLVYTDELLYRETGILVAFTGRRGGVSEYPFDSLDLAAHVGDDPALVDRNRQLLFDGLGISGSSGRLVTAQQVHGAHVAHVGEADAGRGAHASRGSAPVERTDALLTSTVDLPLLMLFADCVPVVVVAPGPEPTVAVAHAGWRGALAGIAGLAARGVCEVSGARSEDLIAYVGPHIGSCCYHVDETVLSQFGNTFGTITAVDGRLDLSAAVMQDLTGAGLLTEAIASVDACTYDQVDRFFSYRARQDTGRHGALAVITRGQVDDTSALAAAPNVE